MDEFNVINQDQSLEDWEKDMNNWWQLPQSFRMRSNDECMRRNGCTVQDFFERVKKNLMAAEAPTLESSVAIDDPIGAILSDGKKYEEMQLKAAEYKDSPYIVLIDPGIRDMEELSRVYDQFLLLSPRCRTLSNEYSYSIYGYTVLNIFEMLKARIAGINIADRISESASIEECIDNMSNYVRNAFINDKTFDMLSYRKSDMFEGIYETYLANQAIDSIVGSMVVNNQDHLEFPTLVPWFTPEEIRENGIDITIDPSKHYGKQLREAVDEEAMVNLGWNPGLDINEYTASQARYRQSEYIKSIANVSNITDVRIAEGLEEVDIKYTLKPLFFVFGKDGFVSLSFSSILDILYEFNGDDKGKFIRFNKIYKEDPHYITNYAEHCEVVMAFLEPDVWEEIKRKCDLSNQDPIPSNGITSVYGILLQSRNRFEPNKRKILYAAYIEYLLKVANYKMDTDQSYCVALSQHIYKVFEGNLEDYDKNRIEQMICLICDEKNIINTLEHSYYVGHDVAERSAIDLKAGSLFEKR